MRGIIKRVLIGIIVVGVVGIVALEWIIQRAHIPLTLRQPVSATPVFLDRHGGLLDIRATDLARAQIPTSIERMGPWLPDVTVALEDHRFRTHPGVDAYGIAAAAWSNLRHGTVRRGGSTITQQLIKQALGVRGRQWKRKAREAILAMKLERAWTKQQILEGYLNRLDYGNRRVGAVAAAWAYFGKDCESLTLGESIYLAGLPQAPSRYNPWQHPERGLQKYQRSVGRLETLGFLTQEQARVLRSWPPSVVNEAAVHRHTHFLNALEHCHQDRGAQSLTTSLDPELQVQCQTFLINHLRGMNRHDVRNGAVVVIENDSGLVRALTSVATPQAKDEAAFNAALVARHAGSTLKPFVYQHAIEEKHVTAASVLADTAESVRSLYADYDPKNFNERYYGPVRLREALGNSLNIPAVIVSNQVQPRQAFERLAGWGLTLNQTFEEVGAGYVLGNLKVNLLELTMAYAALARGGVAAAYPGFVDKATPPMRRIASANACAIVEDILADNAARSRSFGPRSLFTFPAHQRTAVKSGTSSNFRDAWVLGYQRDHTVGVWVGNLNGAAMSESLAVQTAGPVWRQIMNYLTEQLHAKGLSSPATSDGLMQCEIDALSGLIPCPESSGTTTEWFLPGTQPVISSASWYHRETIVLPDSYTAWCRSAHNHLQATTHALRAPGDSEPITITSPRANARYVLDASIPVEAQSLPFLAEHPEPDRLEWRLNGALLNEHPLLWPLTPGEWTLTVNDPESGRTGHCIFRVDP